MKKVRTGISALVGLFLTVMTGIAWAQPGDCPGHGMGPGMMGGMGPGHGGMGLAGLELNDEQRKAINRIVDQNRKRQHELHGKLGDLQVQLRDEYQQEKWNADAIIKIYDQIADVRRQMIRSRIEMRNQIYDRLTPEQRKQFRRTWMD